MPLYCLINWITITPSRVSLPEMKRLTILASCGGFLALVGGLPEGGRCKNAIEFLYCIWQHRYSQTELRATIHIRTVETITHRWRLLPIISWYTVIIGARKHFLILKSGMEPAILRPECLIIGNIIEHKNSAIVLSYIHMSHEVNIYHPKLKFIIEENNNTINFLDPTTPLPKWPNIYRLWWSPLLKSLLLPVRYTFNLSWSMTHDSFSFSVCDVLVS